MLYLKPRFPEPWKYEQSLDSNHFKNVREKMALERIMLVYDRASLNKRDSI